jgi:hypothetical protein
MKKRKATMEKPSATIKRSTRQVSARNSSLRANSAKYHGLDFGRDELTAVMRKTYDEIIDFVATPTFKAFHKELMSLLPKDRPAFVTRVLFEPHELDKRGIVVPEGILIQTSAFGDRRPTLFAVKKLLPNKYHGVWENLNLTFDNEFKDEEVSRAPQKAWRPPLPVALQNALIANGADLESVPSERGVNFGPFAFARVTKQTIKKPTFGSSRRREVHGSGEKNWGQARPGIRSRQK